MSLSIAEAILDAAQVLRRAGVAEARREAGALLAPVLQADRAFIITHAEEPIAPAALATFREWTIRRASGEPLQYITGHQEFFGLDFEVNQEVLIPRPETELLVETALALIDQLSEAPLICDIGTGSGCIIITLLHERPKALGVAVDISPAAASVALGNARRHQVGERVSFLAADIFSSLRSELRFDLIVSNPPYVSERDYPDLQREVRDHEPRVALTSGADGLIMIRRLLADAHEFLVPGGYLLFEIGYDQRAAVEQMIDASIWRQVDIREDLQGIPRIVTVRSPV